MSFKLRPTEIITLLITLGSYIVAYFIAPELPERVASHWNAAGMVDGYVSRGMGAFLLPITLSIVWAALILAPRLDPKRASIEQFQSQFDRFIAALFLFLVYVYGLTIAWNLGASFNMSRMITLGFVPLIAFVAYVISHAKPNWSIGIRTPWTLSSGTVWNKTHCLAGRLFYGASALSLVGVFVSPEIAVWFTLIPLIFVAVVSIVYSYIVYRREQ